MSTDKQSVYVSAQVACSCEALNLLLEAGRATFVLHLECSNTLFRRAYEFREGGISLTPVHTMGCGGGFGLVDAVDDPPIGHRSDGYRLLQ